MRNNQTAFWVSRELAGRLKSSKQVLEALALVQAGQVWIPQRGDQIDWVDSNGAKRTYNVLPRGDEQRVYRFTDPGEQQLRIFCVETKAAG